MRQLRERPYFSFRFRWGHRQTYLSIIPCMFLPSIYRYPFLSVRLGPFEFVHDWNSINSDDDAVGDIL